LHEPIEHQPSRHNDSTSHQTSFLLYAAQEALKSGNSSLSFCQTGPASQGQCSGRQRHNVEHLVDLFLTYEGGWMGGSVSPRRNRRHRGEEPSANLVNTVMASDLVNPCRHREEHQRTEITSPPSVQRGLTCSGERCMTPGRDGRRSSNHVNGRKNGPTNHHHPDLSLAGAESGFWTGQLLESGRW
jgi:hypothetical protein